jgi:hypothetical protein
VTIEDNTVTRSVLIVRQRISSGTASGARRGARPASATITCDNVLADGMFVFSIEGVGSPNTS